MNSKNKLELAFKAFDDYNAQDPHREDFHGDVYPKELLYASRMSERLTHYAPDAAEHIKLAARCQHIGRWEVPRNSFPMDRKGYLQWRSKLSLYHSEIASKILLACGYDQATIEKVKFLLQKKELHQHHPETQLLEDVICLVFIEHYLHDFALEHEDDKVIDILKKTMKKMSKNAIDEVEKIPLSERIQSLLATASQ
jgi:hypothetical protein